MAKKKKKKNFKKKTVEKQNRPSRFALPDPIKKWILGVVIIILAIIVTLSFFDLAGVAGKAIMAGLIFLFGKAVFAVPLILVLGGLIFFRGRYDNLVWPAILAIIVLIIGISGILEAFKPEVQQGGWVGFIFSWPFKELFGILVTKIIFGGIILVGGLIFWHLLRESKPKELPREENGSLVKTPKEKPSILKKIFAPKLRIKEIEPKMKEIQVTAEKPNFELKTKEIGKKPQFFKYKSPPLDLLELDKGKPSAGDTVTNSTIIKKTLENFGLRVEMSEINTGPTVTQYTLKPAEGIRLSKITTLSNNLSLALASHPIRIEAPIPGKSLVGIEVPNKERCSVRLRELIASPHFQNSTSDLIFSLGRDVSGNPCYADLAKMPHLLVAGSTGTGKTIFLNSLILSFLYKNSPKTLKLILIDPKRVEFSAYRDLPHLLCPVIFNAQKTINALRWLVSEMERRFEILSGNGSRDIRSYNEKALKEEEETLPYIVLIVDELADLMAAKGREMEAGIVRLAQMARAVGIHLILATQRPSVEVITGLIKANVTSRITFQVASQVDSRTVLDAAGAEKLLGLGDLLFLSAEIIKPKRIQGAYVSEKEVRKVVEWVKNENSQIQQEEKFEEEVLENHLAEELKKNLESNEAEPEWLGDEDDSLYEEAKKLVIEAKKASASLLQRRLRIGYARAARLIDMLEEKGIVGPGEGAKPREVYLGEMQNEEFKIQNEATKESQSEEEDEGWKKV